MRVPDDGEQPYCPFDDCGAAQIVPRTSPRTDADWWCKECGRTFDEPEHRTPESRSPWPPANLGVNLEDVRDASADPREMEADP